jgi:hypothetical protein
MKKDTGMICDITCSCGSWSAKIQYWKDAFKKEYGGSNKRVAIPDGETRLLVCVCNDCGKEWTETVEP